MTKEDIAKWIGQYFRQVPEDKGENLWIDCPLPTCPNPRDHMAIHPEKQVYHCKRCDSSGTLKGLLTEFHKQCLSMTGIRQYRSLSEARGVSTASLRRAKFAYDRERDQWLVPYFRFKWKDKRLGSQVENMGVFSTSGNKPFVIKKAKKLPGWFVPMYCPEVREGTDFSTVIIVEGEWDALAYMDLFPESNELLFAKPGSGFPQEQVDDVGSPTTLITMFDNDDAGKKHLSSVIGKVGGSVQSIYYLNWEKVESAPNDLRDMLNERGELAAEQILAAIDEVPDEILEQTTHVGSQDSYRTSIKDYEPISCLDEYLEEYKKILYVPRETELAIVAVLGIATSISIRGEPLWAFLIGPPSSGKTTFIDSFGGKNEMFDCLSKITAKSLVSGWRSSNGSASYLAKLRDMTLFVKDFTVTLSEPPDAQREVFGLLTDIFDGYVKIAYGNEVLQEFHDLYFNLVAGVTDKVHSHSSADIGERFLRIDWLGDDYDSRQFASRAVQNFGHRDENRSKLIALTLGMVNLINSHEKDMDIPDWCKDKIMDLAEFVALMRTKAEFDRKNVLLYRPRPEAPGRLSSLFAKLFVATRAVYMAGKENTPEVVEASSKNAMEVVHKVAMDTCAGFSFDIVKLLHKDPGVPAWRIAQKLKIPRSSVEDIIRSLEVAGVIHSEEQYSTGDRLVESAHHLDEKIAKVLR